MAEGSFCNIIKMEWVTLIWCLESYICNGWQMGEDGALAVKDTCNAILNLLMTFMLFVLYKRRKQINTIGKHQGINSLYFIRGFCLLLSTYLLIQLSSYTFSIQIFFIWLFSSLVKKIILHNMRGGYELILTSFSSSFFHL